jgi:hypothetical protein
MTDESRAILDRLEAENAPRGKSSKMTSTAGWVRSLPLDGRVGRNPRLLDELNERVVLSVAQIHRTACELISDGLRQRRLDAVGPRWAALVAGSRTGLALSPRIGDASRAEICLTTASRPGRLG